MTVELVTSDRLDECGAASGTRLHQSGVGRGETILLLHGSGPGASALSNWRLALDALSAKRHCIAPDLLGFGESAHPPEPPSGAAQWIELWVAQVLAVMDALEVDRAHLLGNSLGGAIALHLLHHAPQRFDRAVLMGPAGAPFRLPAELDRAWGFYEDPGAQQMAAMMPWFTYEPLAVGEELDRIVNERLRVALREDVRRSYVSMFPAPRQRHLDALCLPGDAYAQLTHPVLVICGSEDVLVPAEVGRFLVKQLDRAQLHVFGKCRHWVQVERPAAFHALVSSFLDGEL
jgi:2-hydroxymuconate-semialdehyde hydrolase